MGNLSKPFEATPMTKSVSQSRSWYWNKKNTEKRTLQLWSLSMSVRPSHFFVTSDIRCHYHYHYATLNLSVFIFFILPRTDSLWDFILLLLRLLGTKTYIWKGKRKGNLLLIPEVETLVCSCVENRERRVLEKCWWQSISFYRNLIFNP